MTAQTLGEIIEAVRNGERPDYDDLRYAICALDALATFDRLAFVALAEAENKGLKPILTRSAVFQWEMNFNRNKVALSKPPKEYVGWNNDPDNPEFLERRAKTVDLFARVLKAGNGTSS